MRDLIWDVAYHNSISDEHRGDTVYTDNLTRIQTPSIQEKQNQKEKYSFQPPF